MKHIPVILLALCSLLYSGCNLFSGSSFSDGIYINDEIGFSIEFPSSWNKVSRPDFIQSMAFTGVEQSLFISPSNPRETVIAVSTVNAKKLAGPVPMDKLWNTVVSRYKTSGLKIELNTQENINGIMVKRLGGTIKYYISGNNSNYYTEVVLFTLENGLVQIDIFLKEPVNELMRSDLKMVISSIQRFN